MSTALQAIIKASLLRRLLAGQALTLAALWLCLFIWLLWSGERNWQREAQEVFARQSQLIFHASTVLAGQPALLGEAIALLDEHARQSVLIDSFHVQAAPRQVDVWPLTMTSRDQLFVWLDGQTVYRSPGAMSDQALAALQVDKPDTVGSLGKQHRFEAVSPDGRTRVTLLIDSSFVIRLGTEAPTLLLLPLLLSMPLLLLPAWFSVRVALRPLQQLGDEIASRDSTDLSPLRVKPPHLELKRLSSAINELLQRLSGARSRELGFIANAAHELRTPMAAVKLHAQVLLTQSLPAQSHEVLNGLLRSNRRAERMVAQLLALARSESLQTTLTASAVDLVRLLQDCLAEQRPLAHQGGVELELLTQPLPPWHGDADGMRHLIDNLISNAIRHSPPEGRVRLQLQAQQGALLLSVSDQGPGIAPALRQRVFERFYRAPGQTACGSGLGLSIVQAVLKQHGGTIALDDAEAGHGLRVRVWLPMPGANPRPGGANAPA